MTLLLEYKRVKCIPHTYVFILQFTIVVGYQLYVYGGTAIVNYLWMGTGICAALRFDV